MQLPNNKLIISVAGSGKTTYLVRKALKVRNGNVLITTFTEANEKEIRSKFVELNGTIPGNVTIQTWFSFLIQHGIKPYQGVFLDDELGGMLLVNEPSGIKFKNKQGFGIPFHEENEFREHYFSKSFKIYSDKISKFVLRCNEKSCGQVIKRLSQIFSEIYIDEVQDLAGNDLELLKLLFEGNINTTLVGDPRQVTYLTHHERKNKKYQNGAIKQFILDKCKKLCVIDETSLIYSHRNHASICSFSSKLYPDLVPSLPCFCEECRSEDIEHTGIFILREDQIQAYRELYKPIILKYNLAINPDWNYGNCKGLGFDRVLIFPTKGILKYLKNGILKETVSGKEKDAFDIAKFYVALTRAKHSVAIVVQNLDDQYIDGITVWAEK